MTITQFLQGTKAANIMVSEVQSFPPETRLADVAQGLLHQQISGAPVVDESGKCVGVISVVDVIAAEEIVATNRARLADDFFARSDLALPVSVYEEQLDSIRSDMTPAADQPISNFMVTDVVSVSVEDSMERVLEMMIDAHVHRVIVVDANGVLKGLVSTTDVMAAILRASKHEMVV